MVLLTRGLQSPCRFRRPCDTLNKYVFSLSFMDEEIEPRKGE